MANFDVFNGDADGIISLVQLRLASPLNSTLITGYKRDINLLSRVDAGENDNVVALDISMRSNKKDLRIKNKKIVSHLKINVPTFKSNQLPKELKLIPITKPGSRFIKWHA